MASQTTSANAPPKKFPFLWQKLIVILLAAAIFALIAGGLMLPLQPVGLALDHWQVWSDGAWQEITMPSIRAIQPGINTMTLRTTFPSTDANMLIIPCIGGNAIRVWLNEEEIYALGDFNVPTANLWNSILAVQFSRPLQENNTLEIQIASSVFSIGMYAVPFVAPYAEASQRLALLNFVYYDVLLAMNGMAFIVGLILIILCILRRRLWNAEFFIGMALLLSIVFNQDMLFRYRTGDLLTFLRLEKVFLSSGLLAGLFLLLGNEQYIRNRLKYSRWASALTALAILFIVIAPDSYSYTYTSLVSGFLTGLNVLMMIILTFNPSRGPIWVFLPAVFLSLCVFQSLLVLPFDLAMTLVLPYGILICTVFFGVNLVLEFNRLYHDNLNLQVISNIDPLTGVMNRRILDEIDPRSFDFMVVLDLDQFKDLNDLHGHPYGDQVLIQFASIVQHHLRQRDIAIRWGGDEFMLLLSDVPKNAAGNKMVNKIMERIASQYVAFNPELGLTFSYGIVMVDTSFQKSLREADKRMYQMKAEKEKSSCRSEVSSK